MRVVVVVFVSFYRFSLNKIIHNEWMQMAEDRVHIGHFFQVRQPRKTLEGVLEHELKTKLNI